ncbi:MULTISPECIES: HK97 gp10 family phage protein [Erysipelotrichaceae]|jgi:hypothetical protein|uniref:HK97 gp10 family phage protein n=1 Tax=Erysipelotrichaceae TaxID=128827 RepID=UPI000E541C0D|nr:HK97 gp10 family phage protein [Absiella sp. AM27-20]RHU07180.1 HK97 gp10 family phage protein [Absiella sp. AM27-20]DAZ35758.1 MAG TPA: type I neck protein [Caudoviricetes sp.]
MGIGKTTCNINELKDLKKQLENIINEKDEILISLTNEIAGRLWSKTRKRTPVGNYPNKKKHGGTLRRGWTVGEISVNNGVYTVEIINNVHYAPYVEYGHRTRNHTGWVKGQFMLTISEQEINQNLEKIINMKLNKILKDVFK